MRVLLSIGCNTYDHTSSLTGAENDARRIFEALIREDVGEYAPQSSKLLLSPTTGQVREAVREALFSNGAIDTFAFFFAGHGSVKSGSFYMWMRDSRPDAQSVSALSLSELFRGLNEAAPQQSNIIIDACESGGLVSDLGVILKTELLGDAGTPGITLVATSAQDEGAGETDAGGFGTNAILDCIEGRDMVQDSASALDLVEIGRRISDRLKTYDQNPVVWGLNLYGPPRFCRNPFFGTDPARPLRDIIQAWPSTSDASVREHYDELWRAYSSVSGGSWEACEFARVVNKVLSPLASAPDALAGFAGRLGAAALERAELSEDPFRRALVSATFAVCLLQHLELGAIQRTAHRFVDSTASSLIAAGSRLAADLSADRYAFLAKKGGGLSDLFYLPLRIAKALGWLAASRWLLSEQDLRRSEGVELFSNVLRMVLNDYTGSVLVMSDAQAPYWAVALSGAIEAGLNEEAEQLTGLLFHSFVTCRGQLARFDIPAESTLDYLRARHANDFAQCLDLVERPNESLTVLMRAATLIQLDEVFDESLWKIDGVCFSAYLNGDSSQYGAETMTGGQNLMWTIGQDVFRVSDLVRTWRATPSPGCDLTAALVILASLLYADRVPWFCLEPMTCAPIQTE